MQGSDFSLLLTPPLAHLQVVFLGVTPFNPYSNARGHIIIASIFQIRKPRFREVILNSVSTDYTVISILYSAIFPKSNSLNPWDMRLRSV